MSNTLLVVGSKQNHHFADLVPFLEKTAAHVQTASFVPTDLSQIDVIVLTDSCATPAESWERVAGFVRRGGGCLTFAAPGDRELPGMFGAQLQGKGVQAEVRVLHQDMNSPLRHRLPDSFYARGQFQALDLESTAAKVILYADWQFEHRPVLTTHRYGAGIAALTSLQDSAHPQLQRILYRLSRQLAGEPPEKQTLGAGILGYAPSVGLLHGSGIAATPDLKLNAICDLNSARLMAAREHFPDVTLTESAEQLATNSRRRPGYHRHAAELPRETGRADAARR